MMKNWLYQNRNQQYYIENNGLIVHSTICATSDYLLWKEKVLELQHTFIAFKMPSVNLYKDGLKMVD